MGAEVVPGFGHNFNSQLMMRGPSFNHLQQLRQLLRPRGGLQPGLDGIANGRAWQGIQVIKRLGNGDQGGISRHGDCWRDSRSTGGRLGRLGRSRWAGGRLGGLEEGSVDWRKAWWTGGRLGRQEKGSVHRREG